MIALAWDPAWTPVVLALGVPLLISLVGWARSAFLKSQWAQAHAKEAAALDAAIVGVERFAEAKARGEPVDVKSVISDVARAAGPAIAEHLDVRVQALTASPAAAPPADPSGH